MKTITLGLVQHRCSDDNNLDKSIAGIREAAAQGANLVLLQELHNSRYFCQQESPDNFRYAETIPGPSTEALATLSAELDIVIVASLFERRSAGLYHNTAVVLDGKRGIVGHYRKMHIPDDPGYYEKYYFTPGDAESAAEAFQPIETSVGRLGILVCWDQWFPEAARLMALAGAELLLYPTAIGWDEHDDQAEQARQQEAWLTIQRAHAIANGIPVAACNRTGIESADAAATESAANRIHFWGSSFIAGPQGEIIAQAGNDEEAVLVASLNLTRTEAVRQYWPYLRDRRIDAYADLLKRYRD
jgi:N-carbamoylputrescine amidase